ncbi:methyltransferase domain-containing protein [Pseudomonadota bacterium]
MEPRHRYEYEIEPGSAPDRVVRYVGKGKKVLELGSGPGAITRVLCKNECQVTALEIDPDAIEIVREFCDEVYQCDFNDDSWPLALPSKEQFQIVVAADVFEHLYDPWACMKQLHQFLSDDGSLVVSIPHVGHAAVMACLVNSDFDYHSWGLLDSTHIRFFGLTNIQSLFEDAGFKIIEVDFVVTHPDKTELAQHWKIIPERLQQALLSERFSCVYQAVIRAVPVNRPGKSLALTSQRIPKVEGFSITNRLRQNFFGGYIASLIPPGTRQSITAFFKKHGL